jgi:hypothetical protein
MKRTLVGPKDSLLIHTKVPYGRNSKASHVMDLPDLQVRRPSELGEDAVSKKARDLLGRY